MAENNTFWFAVQTRPRWEKKVATSLNDNGIEHYCPLHKVVRQWSDRKVKVYEPLFTSYVFVRVTEKELTEVREVSGIINLVYWLNRPAVIRDSEVETINKFLNDYKTVRLEKTHIDVNDRVRVLRGPLMEYEGKVIDVLNATVKIALPSLGYMMMAEVDKSNVEVTDRFNAYQEPAPRKYLMK